MDSIANAANGTQSRQSWQSQGLSGRRHRKCASNAWDSAKASLLWPLKGGVCVGSNWRVNRKCHEAPQSQMGQQSARRMGLNRDKRLNCDKRLNREWDSSLQGEWDNSLQGEWDSIANGTIVCKANGLSRKCREWDSIATIAGTVYKVSIANERVMRGIVCKASLLVRCGINRKCESNAWDCLLLSLQGGGRHYFEAWREAINREWDCKANGLNPKCRKWDSIATIAETVCMASITNARIMRGTVCEASLLWIENASPTMICQDLQGSMLNVYLHFVRVSKF